MSTSQIVAQHLPYLRRYARALTGTQDGGDAYVAATLEALLQEPTTIADAADPKVALYHVFTRLWNSVPMNRIGDASRMIEIETPADDRIAQLSSQPRQAFVLTALEGFDETSAASILGVPPKAFTDLLDAAGRELAEQMATDVLIIEDEPLIAMDIETLVMALGHSVLGIARTRSEAESIVAERRPGLVLADIQLADGSSGLDAVADILASYEVPVIFITAYPERLLTGQRPEPTFLIAKPFQPQHVRAVISQALFFEQRAKLNTNRAA